MSTLVNLARRYQSLRVARDVLMGKRVDIGDARGWWWFDPRREVERIEAERAKVVDPLADGLRDVFNERLSPDKERAVNAELDKILRSKK